MAKNYDEIVLGVYQELYAMAAPQADFAKMMKKGETKKHLFFMRYYLPIEVQSMVIEKHAKLHKLSTREKGMLDGTIMLGCSPNSAYERWTKEFGGDKVVKKLKRLRMGFCKNCGEHLVLKTPVDDNFLVEHEKKSKCTKPEMDIYRCMLCGKKMKQLVDSITGKKSPYKLGCTCTPNIGLMIT